MQTSIDLEFADGRYTFKLPTTQINEIQVKTGKGIGKVYATLLKGRYIVGGQPFGASDEAEYSLADVIEPIRQGLIGGGSALVDGQSIAVTPLIASRLVENYVYPARPLKEGWTLAVAVLTACIEGYQPPAEKKTASRPGKKSRSKTAGSTTHAPSPTAP